MKLLGKTLVKKVGYKAEDDVTVSTATALAGKKQICLYFGAQWCDPCREFVPELLKAYKASDGSVEIIYYSYDRKRSQCKEYTDEKMDWLIAPYEDKTTKSNLVIKYGLPGIPALIIIDDKGELITSGGRTYVEDGGKLPYAGAPRPKVRLFLVHPTVISRTFPLQNICVGRTHFCYLRHNICLIIFTRIIRQQILKDGDSCSTHTAPLKWFCFVCM